MHKRTPNESRSHSHRPKETLKVIGVAFCFVTNIKNINQVPILPVVSNIRNVNPIQAQSKMVEKVTVQPDHVQYQIDDEDESNSESSIHDTDTSSCSKMNDCKDTSYTDANKELLQEMKGADRSVLCWRVIVRILMISIAILLTSLTYVKLSESETKDFEASVRYFVIPVDFRSWYATTDVLTIIYCMPSTDRYHFSSNYTVMNCFFLLATNYEFLPNH